MNERLNATELLGIARETLLQKILPNLGGELRYDLLMIANAMAIARREFALAGCTVEFEIQTLSALIGVTGDPSCSELQDVRLQLSQQIRAGRFDTADPLRTNLIATLEQVVRRKLAISNPKLLTSNVLP
ncbi:hypothetical protein J3P88_16415 [Pseudomonas sp. Z3-6]|uniref:DUF6285 domain-containing protein n=1 Tax=Pseudomonas sp. Z3-6 TaxID=2817411 RepID=UPI003DA7B12A